MNLTENIPTYISIIFAITTLLTVYFFYLATKKSKAFLILILSWLLLQSWLGLANFYQQTYTIPPKFLLLILPPIALIIGLFTTKKGNLFLDQLLIQKLHLLHVIRIPVELVLYGLYIHKMVPQLMTFEGRNFDILSGISAPILYYFGYKKKQIHPKVILIWNIIGLALLINIVVNAVLSAPFPFQKFAFNQPNIAVLYFPFNLLPSCVVPLVLLSHLASIRQILIENKIKS
ncbi:MAG: hypothetical protein SGJ00_04170 [bacterium]|nr:hypothetical protein [bacterium]